MNGKTTTMVFLGSVLMVSACGKKEGASQQEESGYQLVWADEFDTDGAPNPANWNFERGHVRNQEVQWYQPQNARCADGLLVIEARREQVPNTDHQRGSTDWKSRWKFAKYTSASLITKGLHQWTYGRFEIRARIDVRPGMWPAFWTVGVEGKWPGCGEIDIMEYYQKTLLANVFWQKENGNLGKDVRKKPVGEFADSQWADRFHIWRMDWDEEAIRIYVDDELMNETMIAKAQSPGDEPGENPFRQPHYLIVNLALGGTCGGSPAQTSFPSRYEIDYVRVYQRNAAPGTASNTPDTTSISR